MSYHSIVLVKQVPDTRHVTGEVMGKDGTMNRNRLPAIFNPEDLNALEMALQVKEQYGGTVTVLTMGPLQAAEVLRQALYRGADRVYLISDRKFAGADTQATSYTLKCAIDKVGRFDLIFCGRQAIDGDTAQVGPGVAVRLGLPVVSYAVKIREVNLEQRYVVIERKTENRNEVIKTSLPTAMTCEKDIAEIPFASLPDLVYSLRYEPEVWTAESPIRFDFAQLGLKGSPTTVFKTGTPERHVAGEVFKVAELGVEWVVKAALDKIMAAGDADSILGVKK